MDKSNGYEGIATRFIQVRGQSVNGIGTASVRNWVQTLPLPASVLDLGCGTRLPISKVLLEEGMDVYGVDASPTLVKAFQQNFPNTPVVCEAVEDSSFFHKKFNGIVAWGLIFLLPWKVQEKVIQRAAHALESGGKLLFTAPHQKTTWKDVMTGRISTSLGRKKYLEILKASGLSFIEEFDDEWGNHYYHAVKI